MITFLQRNRIVLSRLVGAGILLLYLVTESYWDLHGEVFDTVLFAIGVFLVGIASLGRMWCSLYIAGYKDRQLVTSGPYSLVRNPLYFFSFFGALGLGFATETFTFPLLLGLLFALYYPLVVKGEEEKLRNYFGEAYEQYRSKVPAFFPRSFRIEEPDEYTVNPKIYRRHIFSALWFVWALGILEIFEALKEAGLLVRWAVLY
ncbi:methyltransferase family protein [Nitratifractor sp.]